MPFLLLLVLLLHYGEGKCCSNFRRWCRRCDAVLLLLMLLLHYGEGKCCPNFRRWCRRYHAAFTGADAAITLRRGQMLQNFRRWCRHSDAVFTAVGAALTLRRGQMLLKFSPWVWALRCRFYCCWCCYYTTARVNAPQIFALGVCVAVPFLLLLVLLLHYAEGKRCSNFRRWCRRCVAVFTAVGAAITLRRGQMLLKLSMLV